MSVSKKSDLLDALSEEEKSKINELREMLQDQLSADRHDDWYLYRFLKARGNDVDKAKEMLQEENAWRSESDIDKLVQEWPETEQYKLLQQYMPWRWHGKDLTGCPVYVERHGQSDFAGILASFTPDEIINHHIYFLEKGEQMKKEGGFAKHLVIEDCLGLSWSHMGSECLALAKRTLRLDEERYPELPRKLYVINTPWVFTMLWNMVKPWLQQRTIDKVDILGPKYLPILEQEIPLDQLPVELGGSCTECKGTDESSGCLSKGGPVPSSLHKYKNAAEASAAAASSAASGGEVVVKVGSGSKHEVRIPVTKAGSIIGYEFSTQSNNIGFGVFFEAEPEPEAAAEPADRTVIKASEKYECQVDKVHDSICCEQPGTYVFVFDNSFSFFKAKNLTYSIAILG